MTKEKLEKEAYQFLIQATKDKKLFYFGGNLEEILAEFAEPREKRIAELEQKLEQTEKDLADYQFNYPTIKELQKENAELKEELKDANKKVVHLACNQNKDLIRKINKAKEIIKNLMVFAEMDDREYEKEYKEAEQFLSEVEK